MDNAQNILTSYQPNVTDIQNMGFSNFYDPELPKAIY
jgi:hypothetical protein